MNDIPATLRKIGEPCPACTTALIARPRKALGLRGEGDAAWCSWCDARYETADDAAIEARREKLRQGVG